MEPKIEIRATKKHVIMTVKGPGAVMTYRVDRAHLMELRIMVRRVMDLLDRIALTRVP